VSAHTLDKPSLEHWRSKLELFAPALDVAPDTLALSYLEGSSTEVFVGPWETSRVFDEPMAAWSDPKLERAALLTAHDLHALDAPGVTSSIKPLWVHTQSSTTGPIAALYILGEDVRQWSAQRIATLERMACAMSKDLTTECALNAMDDKRATMSSESVMRRMDSVITMGMLAASISHELNNPLTYVAGFVEIAEQRAQEWIDEDASASPAQLRELVGLLERSRTGLGRMRGVVRGMSELTNGNLSFQDVRIDELLETALSMAHNELRRRAEIVRDIATRLPSVSGRGQLLGQVFLNLLVNAAHAIPEHARKDHLITVRAFAHGGMVVVQVQDTGGGIPPALHDRIFEPFFTTKPVGQGTGLGLAICREIIEEHGGTISVDSRTGEGSCFTISLPTSASGEHGVSRSGPLVSAEALLVGEPLSVLLVEADAEVGEALAALLERRHDVSLVLDVSELDGVDLAEKFDVCLCSADTPGKHGASWYEDLLVHHSAFASRCVLMTSAAPYGAALGAYTLSAPFTLERVEQALRSVTIHEDPRAPSH